MITWFNSYLEEQNEGENNEYQMICCSLMLTVSLAICQHTACKTDADCDKICGVGMVGHCEFDTCHCHTANECVHASDCTCGHGQIATCDQHQCHCHHHRMWISGSSGGHKKIQLSTHCAWFYDSITCIENPCFYILLSTDSGILIYRIVDVAILSWLISSCCFTSFPISSKGSRTEGTLFIIFFLKQNSKQQETFVRLLHSLRWHFAIDFIIITYWAHSINYTASAFP